MEKEYFLLQRRFSRYRRRIQGLHISFVSLTESDPGKTMSLLFDCPSWLFFSGRERGREGRREGRRERGKEGGREGRREGEREGGREGL